MISAIKSLVWSAITLILSLTFLQCDDSDSGGAAGSTSEQLQALIDDMVASDSTVPGVVLRVSTDSLDFAGVAGEFEHDGAALELDDVFRAASITKTLTSAALHVLEENGELSLDDTIDNHLSTATESAISGTYATDSITIGELLNHTAGMFDYTEADEYYDAINADPSHQWTRAEQVNYAITYGSKLNEPGDEFHYGDTHYILAGEIIERITGENLNDALASLLKFDELGINDSWMETIGDAPSADFSERISHPYIGDQDTRDWHASWDLWGGGGLATTAEDLMTFNEALFTIGDDGIFAEQSTLDAMLTVVDVAEGEFFGMDGGYGIGKFNYEGIGDCYAGFGFFTTILVHCPDANIMYAGTANQSEPEDADALLEGVLEILAE